MSDRIAELEAENARLRGENVRLLRFRYAVERAVYNLADSPKSLLHNLRALLAEKEQDR